MSTDTPEAEPRQDILVTFDFSAATEAAERLAERILAAVLASENRKRARGAEKASEFKSAVERLLGEVLMAKAEIRSTGRAAIPSKKENFTGRHVSWRDFKSARDAMVSLGLIHHQSGKHRWRDFDWGDDDRQTVNLGGKAATYEATSLLLSWAEDEAITPGTMHQHFRRPLLRARNSAGMDVRFRPSRLTERLTAELEEINAFLSGFKISAPHIRFYRQFNVCDDASTYGWDKGGRLYSEAEPGSVSYQNLSGQDRAGITIDGSKVIELDIAASQLTIFHALVGQPLTLARGEDLYARVTGDIAPSALRPIVKGWIVASLGNNKPCKRWSDDMTSAYAKKNAGAKISSIITAPKVGQLVLKTFPALHKLGSPGSPTWADLQFAEATVLTRTLQMLMRRGIPALPVHDSLIIKASDAGEAARALYGQFAYTIGVLPIIKTKSEVLGANAVEEAWEDYGGHWTVREPRVREMAGLAVTEC
ncbi:hypothetical protein NP284_10795 [Rhodopseudomonas pseudopalustris]|uniref:hypothetical protein n=1 Tax=Rhodopseudomonas pseudopalustris TaxID=1513892 RepID=UPI003F9D5377